MTFHFLQNQAETLSTVFIALSKSSELSFLFFFLYLTLRPLVGSGQDPRVKVGTTSILGGQGQGPRMRAGTTPVWGGQRSRPQGESRDTPLWPEVENLSSVCPHIPPIRPTPHQPSCGQQGSLEPQQGLRRQVPGNCGLNQGGEGTMQFLACQPGSKPCPGPGLGWWSGGPGPSPVLGTT